MAALGCSVCNSPFSAALLKAASAPSIRPEIDANLPFSSAFCTLLIQTRNTAEAVSVGVGGWCMFCARYSSLPGGEHDAHNPSGFGPELSTECGKNVFVVTPTVHRFPKHSVEPGMADLEPEHLTRECPDVLTECFQ